MTGHAIARNESESILIDIAYKIYHSVESELAHKLKNKILKQSHRAILIYVSKNNQANPSNIANHLGFLKSRVTRNLRTLESEAYLKRVYDVKDRRRCFLELLPKGKEVINATKPILSSLPDTLMPSLNKEENKALTAFLDDFST